MIEEWRDIEGLPGYQISSTGRARSVDRYVSHGRANTIRRRGKILTQSLNNKGYPKIMVCINGRSRMKLVHHLVAEAFIGPRPCGMQVAHKNGIKSNCEKENLKYATQSENMNDKFEHGTMVHGSAHSWSKLTENDVNIIRLRLADGEDAKIIASSFGVIPDTIRAIKNGKSWRGTA